MTQLTLANGTPVSRLAFGTMQFGGSAEAAASHAMYDAARAAGITHFDTAVSYTDGHSETLLGECVRSERDSIYLATKVAHNGSSRANMTSLFDTCRRRLKLDAVDLLYLHRWDSETALEEPFQHWPNGNPKG